MALPIIETPKYELTIPSTGKKLEYRPYLVKEEKILMMAMESKDSKQILRALADVVESCAFGKIKAKDLTSFDLEYIFLQLRSQSVGSQTDFLYPCSECGEKNEMNINLEDVKVQGVEKKKKTIALTDSVGVTLRYLSIKDMESLIGEKEDADTTMKLIAKCIDSVYDAEKIYPAFESTEEELVAFIESLSSSQFEKIKEFIESMPKLSHTEHFKCTKCGSDNTAVLQGLQSFF